MKRLILLFIILFIAVGVYLISLPPRDITLDDLSPSAVRKSSPEVPVTIENTIIDSSVENDFNSAVTNEIKSIVTEEIKSSETIDYEKTSVNYYIIVESFRNLTLAKQKAEKLKNEYGTNIIVLPPTKEGYYRISCGSYSTMEEAKSNIAGVKKNFGPNVWIFYGK